MSYRNLERTGVQISCIFWVFWILIDIYATFLRFRELDRMEAELPRNPAGGEAAAAAARDRAAIAAKRQNLWLYMVRLLFWLPNAVHWSLPPGTRPAPGSAQAQLPPPRRGGVHRQDGYCCRRPRERRHLYRRRKSVWVELRTSRAPAARALRRSLQDDC